MSSIITNASAVGTGGTPPSSTVKSLNFGPGGNIQPSGYVNGHIAYNATVGHGWISAASGGPPQCFTRANASDASSVEHTFCRVDSYYDSTINAWVDTGFEAIRYRVDVPNDTYTVSVRVGDPSLYAQDHTAWVSVSGDGGVAWQQVHDHTVQSASVTASLAIAVTSGYILFRFGQESANVNSDRTALSAITITQGGVVGSNNAAPIVVTNAAPQSRSTGSTANLTASVTDDGLPSGNLTYQWTQISGPTAAPANPTLKNTTVNFPTAGTYVYRLTASDGSLTDSNDLVFNVTDSGGGGGGAQAGPTDRNLYMYGPIWWDGMVEWKQAMESMGLSSAPYIGYFGFSQQLDKFDNDQWVESTSGWGPGKMVSFTLGYKQFNPNAPFSLQWGSNIDIEAARPSHPDYNRWLAHVQRWARQFKEAQDQGKVHDNVVIATGMEFTGHYESQFPDGATNYQIQFDHSPQDYAYWFAKSREIVLNAGCSAQFVLAPNGVSAYKAESITRDVLNYLNADDYDLIGMSAYPNPNFYLDDDKGPANPSTWESRNKYRFMWDLLYDLGGGKDMVVNEVGFQRTGWHLNTYNQRIDDGAVNRITQINDFWRIIDEYPIKHVKYFSHAKIDKGGEEYRLHDTSNQPASLPPIDYSEAGAQYAGERAYTIEERNTFLRGAHQWLVKGTPVGEGDGDGGSGDGNTGGDTDTSGNQGGGGGGDGTAAQFLFIEDDDIIHNGTSGPSQWIVPKVNWPAGGMMPYVNGGSMYARFEVVSKPSNKLVSGQMCIWQRENAQWTAFEETCAPWRFLQFTGTGVYYAHYPNPINWHTAVSDRSTGNFDWSRDWKTNDVCRLFMRAVDDKNNLMTYNGCGDYCYKPADLNQHVPITVRQEWWAVKPGATFIPPGSWTGHPW